MLSLKTKIICFSFIIIVVACITFLLLWQDTSSKLSKAHDELTNALSTVESLQKDNEKLVTYIQKKDEEIKKIEKQYKDKIKNIPMDACGDVKPSKELLKYFRSSNNE